MLQVQLLLPLKFTVPYYASLTPKSIVDCVYKQPYSSFSCTAVVRMPLLQRETPTLGARLYDMLQELIQELVLYFLKFKAWLTPGDADDKVRTDT